MGPPHLCHHTLCPWMKVVHPHTTEKKKKTETKRVRALTLSRSALRAVCNGIRGLLGADLLPISVHTRKVAHSMAQSAQADSRENKERYRSPSTPS